MHIVGIQKSLLLGMLHIFYGQPFRVHASVQLNFRCNISYNDMAYHWNAFEYLHYLLILFAAKDRFNILQ